MSRCPVLFVKSNASALRSICFTCARPSLPPNLQRNLTQSWRNKSSDILKPIGCSFSSPAGYAFDKRQYHHSIHNYDKVNPITETADQPKSQFDTSPKYTDKSNDENRNSDRRPPDDESGPVATINRSIYDQPIETLISVISMEMVTIYGIHAMLKYSGVAVPPDLAVAFILSRPLRRVRLPLELAVAEVLSRVFPALTRIHVMQMFRAFPGYTEPDWMKDGMSRDLAYKYCLDNAGLGGKSAEGTLQKGVAKFAGAIDKYGAAYTVGSRVTGVCIIMTLFTGLKNGVDVSSFLQSWGFEGVEKAGTMISTWAGAILLSSVLFPFNAYCGARIAPFVKKLRKSIIP